MGGTVGARQRAYCVLALMVVGGCTHPVGPDYVAPQPLAASAQGNAKVLEQKLAHPQLYADASPSGQWWRLYQDAQLNDLIGQALGRNTTLLEALGNLQRVRAVEEQVTGQRRALATVSAGPSYGHASGLSRLQPGSVPANAWLYSTGAAVSYQLDMFGKLERASEAAAADSDAAVAAMDMVRISVAAATAQAYADVCSGGMELDAARESLQVQQQARRVTEQLQRAGHAGSVDSIRAQAQERQLAAAIAPLQAQRQAALYRLAA
ncbi:TolC family protein [Pseudomonas sp. NPDC090592]|uniref:TolC family protein n=1 Tax=Pseudomonas sp. NPDC090592 TaxID=3364480 RepID=UPI00383AD3BB